MTVLNLRSRLLPGAVRRGLAALGLALLAACDGDVVEMAQEIEAARGDCTTDSLKAGAEECVQMMQRYTEMGVDAMETYIGAVQALDEALRRMPPPQFDTAGIGHALTPGAAYGDSPFAAPDEGPSASPRSAWPWGRSGGRAAPRDRFTAPEEYPRGDDGYPRPYPGPQNPYDAPYADPYGDGYGGDYGDPYSDPHDGDYGGSYPAPYGPPAGDPYGDPYARDPYGSYPGGPDPGYRGTPGYSAPDVPRDGEPPVARPPAAPYRPPARGLLLPPEQRLRRPWIDEAEEEAQPPVHDGRADYPPRYPKGDTVIPGWDRRDGRSGPGAARPAPPARGRPTRPARRDPRP